MNARHNQSRIDTGNLSNVAPQILDDFARDVSLCGEWTSGSVAYGIRQVQTP